MLLLFLYIYIVTTLPFYFELDLLDIYRAMLTSVQDTSSHILQPPNGKASTDAQVYISHMVKACYLTVPYFQLIQTFKESPRAICHGQSPAEFATGSLVHLRLYFRLSHDGDCLFVSFFFSNHNPIQRLNPKCDQHS